MMNPSTGVGAKHRKHLKHLGRIIWEPARVRVLPQKENRVNGTTISSGHIANAATHANEKWSGAWLVRCPRLDGQRGEK